MVLPFTITVNSRDSEIHKCYNIQPSVIMACKKKNKKKYRHSSNFLLCITEERKSYRFGISMSKWWEVLFLGEQSLWNLQVFMIWSSNCCMLNILEAAAVTWETLKTISLMTCTIIWQKMVSSQVIWYCIISLWMCLCESGSADTLGNKWQVPCILRSSTLCLINIINNVLMKR